MQDLPKVLRDEIDLLETMDARALHRKYPTLLGDIPECAVSGILRAMVAYRLQERHYGLCLTAAARDWLVTDDNETRLLDKDRKIGSGARLVRNWRGKRYEAIVRDDGKYEYDGKTYNSLSAVATAITGTHWNGKLFFGIK